MPTVVYPEWTMSCPKIEDLFSKIVGEKRILIDIDGVICEYNFPLIVKNFFGIDLSAEAIYAYDLADVLGVAPLLIDTMFKEQVYGKPNLVTGAIETLTEWKAKDYELLIFSKRTKYMGYEGLIKWLIEWQIPFNDVDLFGKGVYDYFVDDRPSKLQSVNSKVKLLYDRPWNRGCRNIEKNLIRVYDWQTIRDIVGGRIT